MAGAIHVNDTNFNQEVIQAKQPVLVDFWAEWCVPCRMIMPIIDDLSSEYAGRVKFTKADVDQCQEIPAKYAVTSIPTLLLFKDGQPMDKIVGAVSKAKLKGLIDGAL